MRSALVGTLFLALTAAFAQEPTAEQIIEKSIQATGGREALQAMKSYVAKGTLEIVAMGVTAPTEVYRKAPDKAYNITSIEGYGDVRRGFDGKVGWSDEPQNGLVDLQGEELAVQKREAQFHGELNWKQMFPKAEVTGKGKVGARDCYIVVLTPTEGKPVTRYYDVETGLLAKQVQTTATAQGEMTIPTEISDYKDVGGVKIAHTMKMDMPGIGELLIRLKDVQANVAIDDAKFAKPGK